MQPKGRLTEWSDEQRLDLANLIVEYAGKIRPAFKAHRVKHPDSHEYGYPTVLKYARSKQGRAEVGAIREAQREEVREAPLVHRGERLYVLRDLLALVLEKLQVVEVSRELTDLVNSARMILRDIREEAAPYDLEAGDGTSFMEAFFRSMQTTMPSVSSSVQERIEAPDEESN
jgi:hypothetical protein